MGLQSKFSKQWKKELGQFSVPFMDPPIRHHTWRSLRPLMIMCAQPVFYSVSQILQTNFTIINYYHQFTIYILSSFMLLLTKMLLTLSRPVVRMWNQNQTEYVTKHCNKTKSFLKIFVSPHTEGNMLQSAQKGDLFLERFSYLCSAACICGWLDWFSSQYLLS